MVYSFLIALDLNPISMCDEKAACPALIYSILKSIKGLHLLI
jgi:hypothetical protein